MFSTKTHKTAAFLAIGIACLAAPCVSLAAGPIQLSGVITGVVSDSMGIPQMGAIVLLYNRQDRVYGKVQTDDLGQFSLRLVESGFGEPDAGDDLLLTLPARL